ncbi:thioredoxin domain-containing protein [Thermoleophilia bacterium SCSIO 60948]|nr:thioredoxin domain-containing protein [Thermoleophilia bacterium SCSIO 60948]
MSDDAPSPTPDPDRRKRAFALGGGAILLAAIVVAVLIVTSQSGSDDTPSDSDEDFATLLEELPQDGPVIGDPDAPVRIVEWGDLQCPACAAYSRTTIPELITGPVADGEASLEFRNYVIIGPESVDAGKAAIAAGEQGRLWQFVEEFYARQGPENSGYVTEDFLTGIAEDAGIEDIDAWNDAREAVPDKDLIANVQQAQELGLTGTPSVTVQQGADGDPQVVEDTSTEAVEAAVAEQSE